MAIHSSILAWRIPWTKEPSGLQSIGLQSQTQLRQLSKANSNKTYWSRAWTLKLDYLATWLHTSWVILGSYITFLCLNFLICKMGVITTHTSQDTRIPVRKKGLCLLNILETLRTCLARLLTWLLSPRMKNPPFGSKHLHLHPNALPIISKSRLHQYLLPLSAISPSLLALSSGFKDSRVWRS